jgi:hypothetical protein
VGNAVVLSINPQAGRRRSVSRCLLTGFVQAELPRFWRRKVLTCREIGNEVALCLRRKGGAEEVEGALVQNPIADLISVPFQNNINFNFGPRKPVRRGSGLSRVLGRNL